MAKPAKPAKKASAKKVTSKKAPAKKDTAKRPSVAKKSPTRTPATAPPAKEIVEDLVAAGPALPSWATKKPEGEVLPVPTKLKDAIAKALGPLDRRYGITQSVGMNAMATRQGWGLHRTLSVEDGAGPELAKVWDVLAAHELPLLAADFWYPSEGTPSVDGAAAIFDAALASPNAARLIRLTVLLQRLAIEPPIADALARAVARMPVLEVLGLNARGGAGALRVVEACGPLDTLELCDLAARELSTLATLPALSRLRALALKGTDADDASIAALLGTPWAAQLHSLELSKKMLLPADYRSVAALGALTSLNLRFPDDATIAAIADASFVPSLTRLELHDCRIELPVARRLAARGLPQLTRLVLKHAEISDAALKLIVDAAPHLSELGIPNTTRPQPWAKRGRMVL